MGNRIINISDPFISNINKRKVTKNFMEASRSCSLEYRMFSDAPFKNVSIEYRYSSKEVEATWKLVSSDMMVRLFIAMANIYL